MTTPTYLTRAAERGSLELEDIAREAVRRTREGDYTSGEWLAAANAASSYVCDIGDPVSWRDAIHEAMLWWNAHERLPTNHERARLAAAIDALAREVGME